MMRSMKLKGRVVLFTIIAMSVLTIMLQLVGYYYFSHSVRDNYVKYATAALNEADAIFKKYKMGDLINARSMGEGYDETRAELNMIKNSADIEYLYSMYFEDINDVGSVCYVINAKSDEELSTGEALEDIYSFMGEELEEGAYTEKDITVFRDAIVNDRKEVLEFENITPEYGHVLTCYKVVRDSSGVPNAILGVDIDINEINTDLRTYIYATGLIGLVLAGVLVAVFVITIDRRVTRLVTSLSESTDDFVKQLKDGVSPENLDYKSVTVRTQDEIRILAENISSMADGLKTYMINLRDMTAEKERIGAELSVATQIQADMLPTIFPPFPTRDEFDIYASMNPAKEVGGDFYDFFMLDDDHLALVIADVSGKGVPAALFMVISKTLIKNQAQNIRSPKEILETVNNLLCENNAENMFVTVWLGIVEISTGKVTAANAGHEYPAIKGADGEYTLIKDKHGMVAGVMEDIKYTEYEFTLEKGGSLFVYTDGVPEATRADNEMFGIDNMLKALNSEPEAAPEKLLKNVRASVDEFVGDAPQFDDLTMLCINYHG